MKNVNQPPIGNMITDPLVECKEIIKYMLSIFGILFCYINITKKHACIYVIILYYR